MPPGILDLSDKQDRLATDLIALLTLSSPLSRADQRTALNLAINIRALGHEIRRRIEREYQETPT